MDAQSQIEKALLGGLLLDDSGLPSVIQVVDPSDFYHPTHQRIYRAIIEQKNSNEPIDFVSIYYRIQELEFDIFAQLNDAALPSSVSYLASIVRDAANRRNAQNMLRASLDALGQPAADLESQFETLSTDFVKLLAGNSTTVTLADGLVETLKNIENSATRKIMKTGLSTIDDAVGGMFPGDYWVIAGRPSMGKSAAGQNICLNLARDENVCAYFSLEGSNESLRCRLLSIDSGVWMSRIKSGRLRDIDYAPVADSASRLGLLPVYTYDAECRWEKIKAAIELLKFKEPRLSVVFVDYLGLMRAHGYRERWQEIGAISAEFKRLCVSIGIVGVMLVQINRQTESRKDHKPNMGDIRDSGSVEQDADVILLLYRPSYYQEDDDETLTQVCIAKNRDGATGNIELAFDAPCVRFRDRVSRGDWRDMTEPQEA